MDSKIDRENADILKIDKDARNKFKWAWLNESKDFNGDFPSDYVLKSTVCGKALCSWCQVKVARDVCSSMPNRMLTKRAGKNL